jgi:hypothetical protein
MVTNSFKYLQWLNFGFGQAMELLRWLLRCIPGFSTLILLFLIEYSLQIGQNFYLALICPECSINPPTIIPIIFCVYSILLHLIALLFPFRLIWAVKYASKSIWEEHLHRTKSDRGDCIHAIIVPCYKESYETINETLMVLANHQGAKSYDVSVLSSGDFAND